MKKALFLNILLSLLWVLPCPVAGQKGLALFSTESHSQQIRKLNFKGNKEFSDKDLEEAISFSANKWLGQKLFRKEPSFYSEEAARMNIRELQHFYQSEGFLNVVIEEPIVKTKKRNAKVELTFVVKENEPITIDTVIFAGQDTLHNEQLRNLAYKGKRKLTALQGKRFRDELIWDDRDQITSYLVDRGYAYAETAPLIETDTATKTATIIWENDAGPLSYFGKISISGQERTPEKLIRGQLAFEEGDVYSRAKLNRSQQQVYQLGTFRIASMKAQLSREKKDSIPVTISITEAPATSTRVGVGFGREDRFRTFVNFQVLNFPGGARKLNLYAKHSALEPYRFEVKLTQPAVFSPNSTLTLAPTVKKQKESGYELFSYSATLTLLQRITDELNSSFSLYYEKVQLDTTSIAQITEAGTLLDNYSKGGVTAGILYDNASPRFNPNNGFTVAFNAKSNSMILPGRYPFIKYQLEAKNYQILTDGLIFASRLKLGLIHTGKRGDGLVPVEERFFAGGSRSVRGWARQQLGPKDGSGIPTGGNSSIEASIEPRIALFGPLSMVVFMDAGNVWQNAGDFALKQIRLSGGGGLRFETPIGPVGIDAARPVWDDDSQWQIHFNIGHAF